LSIWTALIAILFIYVIGMFSMNALVTGTSAADTVMKTIVPLIFAIVGVGILARLFR